MKAIVLLVDLEITTVQSLDDYDSQIYETMVGKLVITYMYWFDEAQRG
jgi:hypothetical protein